MHFSGEPGLAGCSICSLPAPVQEINLREQMAQDYCRMDALPVVQPVLSKH